MRFALAAGALVTVGLVAWWLQRVIDRHQQYQPDQWIHRRACKAWEGKEWGT